MSSKPDPPPAPDEAVEIPFDDVLDLHTFAPRDVADVVRHYLDLAIEAGVDRVRIIHGKGIGAQRQTVRTILERDGRVEAYGDAGSWGATWATLRAR